MSALPMPHYGCAFIRLLIMTAKGRTVQGASSGAPFRGLRYAGFSCSTGTGSGEGLGVSVGTGLGVGVGAGVGEGEGTGVGVGAVISSAGGGVAGPCSREVQPVITTISSRIATRNEKLRFMIFPRFLYFCFRVHF